MAEESAAPDGMHAALRLPEDHPVAVAVSEAIHTGDLESLRRLLSENPGLAGARLVNKNGRSATPLHMATDWPGFFPGGPAVVVILIQAGADPDLALEGGRWPETPLHWAASSDDVEVARALLDGGADTDTEDINDAFWQACGGGHRRMAEYLFARGADVNAAPDWAERTPLDVAGGGPEGPGLDTGSEALVTWLREKGARSAKG